MKKGKGDMDESVSEGHYNQGTIEMPLVLLSSLMKHDLFLDL